MPFADSHAASEPEVVSPPIRWTLRPVPDETTADALAATLNGLPPALARALVLRGVRSFDEARTFFRPALCGLHDPFGMRDMDVAAER
ncbi:MAG TPA: hypothetical protein VF576_12600, partial [Rubricoccaceae bacterium]